MAPRYLVRCLYRDVMTNGGEALADCSCLPTPESHVTQPVVDALLDEAQRAERLARRELARRRYESALYLIRVPEQAHDAAFIFRRIARLYIDDGDLAAGADCLGAALAISNAINDVSGIAHATNILALSQWQRGRLDDGERLYKESRQLAQQAGDARLVAMVDQNLGLVANMRGDLPRALEYFEASLRGYEALGLTEHLAQLLNHIGMANADLERWESATRAYDAAIRVCEEQDDVVGSLRVRNNRAEMWIALREFDRARAECEHVLRESWREPSVSVDAYKHLGIISSESGESAEAERLLGLALDCAMTRDDLVTAAEIAREKAELYARLERPHDTLRALSASHRLFSKLRARRDVADVTGRIGMLERRFASVVERWGQSIELKDRYTLGHCRRVSNYTCAIARDLAVDEVEIFWLRIGALLHDIGKMTVPSEILNKPSALTPQERQVLERHTESGAALLADVDMPTQVFEMIRWHHERWDGTGYPDRLSGTEIPLCARILCVADVYDALTSDRPYRRAFSREHALRLMRRDEGRVFDPDVLARFERVVRTLPEQRFDRACLRDDEAETTERELARRLADAVSRSGPAA